MSLAHSAYTTLLSLLTIWVATGFGRVLLDRLPIRDDVDPFESLAVSFGLGFGVLGLGIFILGVAGGFNGLPIAATVVAMAAVSARGMARAIKDVRRVAAASAGDWGGSRAAFHIVLGLAASIGILVALLALAPPWAYDGLMYHLQAPRIFLERGRVIPLPNILQANGPLLGQMIFSTGLALGSDAFSQLVHATFGAATLLAALAAGRRWLGPPGGWLAAGILLGIPIFSLLGTLAYVDMIHALFEFLAVWAILRWDGDRRPAWLALSATMAGLAIGTKLVALLAMPALTVWLVILARKQGWPRALVTGGSFALAAGAVGLIWYAFSWATLGDPLYPIFAGGPEWPPVRLALHTDYLRSFGTGRSLADFLLLPFNLFFRHETFATMMQSIEFPSFLFPLAILAPLLVSPGPIRALAWFALLRLATWYLGSQQTRFLLPIYPVLSLLTAGVLLKIESRIRRIPAPPRFSAGIVGGLILTSLVYVAIYFDESDPLPAVLGLSPRSSFLEPMVGDYRALRYIRAETQGDSRILQLWDGQGYYCDHRCISDPGQVFGPYLYSIAPTIPEMTAELASRGVTHILIELESMSFLLQHDPKGTHRTAAQFFLGDYLGACGALEYEDSFARVYRLTCLDPAGLDA